MNRWHRYGMAMLLISCLSGQASAQIKVGVDLSTSGAAASIGLSSRNAILLWPKEIAGKKIEYLILDDGSDPGMAVRNVRKLIAEERVDLIVGPTTTPASLAVLDVIAENETPMINLTASSAIVEPMDAKRFWAFKMPQNDTHMATILTQYMADHSVKTVGFIGFADAYGEGWWKEFSKLAEVRKIKIVANERFARTDSSVTAQTLKIMASRPDAVFIAGAGTPAVLPQKTLLERGYKGQIYQSHGIASPEFLKLGGKDVEGTLFPTGPAVVAAQLPVNHPSKKVAMQFSEKYAAAYGGSMVTQFAADAWGAYLLFAQAVPAALQAAAPGSKAFRAALRTHIESTQHLVVPQGVINMSPSDHVGLDQRSRVMGKIQSGKFIYVEGS